MNRIGVYLVLSGAVLALAACSSAATNEPLKTQTPTVITPAATPLPTQTLTREIILRDGEVVSFPVEAFETREVNGVGVTEIEVVTDKQGEVEYFHLIHTGLDGGQYDYWTSLIDIQPSPEVIENYTRIDLADIWSGRVLFSELLTIEPLDQGAGPSGFYYLDWIDGSNILIGLSTGTSLGPADVGGGCLTELGEPVEKWSSFYFALTPSGEELIVATRQILFLDGRSSLFFHYAFGHEWPWDRNYVDSYDLSEYNIIDSLFLNREPSNHVKFQDPGPAIYFAHVDGDVDNFFYVIHGPDAYGTTGAKELYNLPQNHLAQIADFSELLVDRAFNDCVSIVAGEEIAKLQNAFLLTASAHWTPMSD